MIINPYKTINWETCQHICSISHGHAKTQEHFNNLYNGGVKHMAISNYYRSEPFYPAINNIISNIDSVDNITIPNDVILSPNAEHHNMDINALHICSIGSFFSSGAPEIDNGDGTFDRTGLPKGMGGQSWKTLVRLASKKMQYKSGGGLTINHPTWTNLSFINLYEMLDYTEIFIGMEAYNTDLQGDLSYWDSTLLTGRKVWGLFVPDHKHKTKPEGNWLGRNILLVDNLNQKSCLKAYKKGTFYGKLGNSNLMFTSILLSNKILSINTNSAESIIIIEDGQRTEYTGSSCVHNCSKLSTYVRIEANGLNDTIYSQPIIFKPRKKNKGKTLEAKKRKHKKIMWI